MAQGVGQDEALLSLGFAQQPQQRLGQGRRLGGVAAFEEALGDGLEGVGDPLGVARGDAPVRPQALEKVALPDLGGLVQNGHHRRGQGRLGRGLGQLLAVAGAGVGQNLAHQPPGPAADIALVVHQKLVEELQRLLLAGPGHIGAVLVQQPEIRPHRGRGALAPSLLQQPVKGLLGGDGVHQTDVALKGHSCQPGPGLGSGQKGRVLDVLGAESGVFQIDADAVVLQKGLEIPELAVDGLIPPLFLGRHVGQLGEDHVPALFQRVDAHDFPAVFPVAPDAEVGVDQKEGLHREVLKLQVPGGVVGGHVADLLQPGALQPGPGVVVVEVGGPLLVGAAAAEFAHVVAEAGGGHQRQIHRQARLPGQDGGVERHVVDADDVGGGVKGHGLPPDTQERHQVHLADQKLKLPVFRRHPAFGHGVLRHRQQVGQRVEGVVLAVQRPGEGGEVDLLGGFDQCRVEPGLGVGVELGAEVAVAPGEEALLRLRRQQRPAGRQDAAAEHIPRPGQHVGQQRYETFFHSRPLPVSPKA